MPGMLHTQLKEKMESDNRRRGDIHMQSKRVVASVFLHQRGSPKSTKSTAGGQVSIPARKGRRFKDLQRSDFPLGLGGKEVTGTCQLLPWWE